MRGEKRVSRACFWGLSPLFFVFTPHFLQNTPPLRACHVCVLKHPHYNSRRTLCIIIFMHIYRIFYNFYVYPNDLYTHLSYIILRYIYSYFYYHYELKKRV